METYCFTHEHAGHRLRWVYDTDYVTRGSYGYETEEETKAAEDEEIAKLESGELVCLGAIYEVKCLACNQWEDKDSLWGIVIEPDEQKITTFGSDNIALA